MHILIAASLSNFSYSIYLMTYFFRAYNRMPIVECLGWQKCGSELFIGFRATRATTTTTTNDDEGDDDLHDGANATIMLEPSG